MCSRWMSGVLTILMIATASYWTDPGTESFAADAPPLPRKILLDTDPGGDDVFALLWLQSLAMQGHAEIVAVTTVGGNVRSEYTFVNACKVLSLGGFNHIEVGRAVSSHSSSEDAAYIHGADGMGNLSLTLPPSEQEFADARPADEIIIEKLNAAPGEVTLVAVGPLTNLAAAEKKSPGILAKAKEVVIMGGAFHCGGNVTPSAEFNIAFDPESARIVFNSRDDLALLPLDVTQQTTLTVEQTKTVLHASPHSRVAQFVDKLCQFMSKTTMEYRSSNGVQGFHVHDAATFAYLFYPETLMFQRVKVRVETQGELTRGQTVFDNRHRAKTEANAWAAMEVDAVNLLAILLEDLKVLSKPLEMN